MRLRQPINIKEKDESKSQMNLDAAFVLSSFCCWFVSLFSLLPFSLCPSLHHFNVPLFIYTYICNVTGIIHSLIFLQFWLKHFPSSLFNLTPPTPSPALPMLMYTYNCTLDFIFQLSGAVSSCYRGVYIIIRQLHHLRVFTHLLTPTVPFPPPCFYFSCLWIAIQSSSNPLSFFFSIF